ncbi:MAG TPA: hypothetical protein VJP80_06920 [Candidatus Saccharimonadales bacterium]|nr:hypothetical protein [Candidatus Saccharimonadales bacterium]
MDRPELSRALPRTAQELVDAHPYVGVERTAYDTLTVLGSMGGAYEGLRAHVFAEAADNAGLLRVQAILGGCPDYTELIVPRDAGLPAMAITHSGDAPVGESIGMVRDGVSLFDNYWYLSAEERTQLPNVTSGDGMVRDALPFEELNTTLPTLGETSYRFDVLNMARAIFLS